MGKEKESGIDHVYVVSAPKRYERNEKRRYDILGQYGFDFEFLGDDPEELSPHYFVENIGQVMNREAVLWTLNHIMFYETMIKKGDKMALILEDDPFFSKHFFS
jgi:hypothetical protein